MRNKSEMMASIPAPVQKVSSNLQRWGFWGFWTQLVLGIISLVTLLLSTPILFQQKGINPANQFGILCAFCSIIALSIAIFRFYFRYKKIGQAIKDRDAEKRPRKSDTVQLIKIGLIMNLTGMLFAILGAEALIGFALGKSLILSSSSIVNTDPQKSVNALDLLIIQANTNTIIAHFAGIVSSLLLLNKIS